MADEGDNSFQAETLGNYSVAPDRNFLCIDFNRPHAYGALLVIDDQWHWVQRMLVGKEMRAGVPVNVGIGVNGLEVTGIKKFWEGLQGRTEPLIKALLHIPWAIADEDRIGKLVF